MKRLIAIAMILVLCLSGMAYGEELKRGKSWDITKSEWLTRYNSLTQLDGSAPLDDLIFAGESDYRRTYVSIIDTYIQIGLMCEDTTDRVFAFVLMLDINSINGDYYTGVAIGEKMADVITKSMYACDDSLSASDVGTIYDGMDCATIVTTPGARSEKTQGHSRFVAINNNGQFTFAISNTDTFESEEEFLEYRGSTMADIR